MKAKRTPRPVCPLLLLLILSLLPAGAEAALVLLVETFDDGPTPETYSAYGVFSDGADDYFAHIAGGPAPSGLPDYMDADGGFWAVEDVDALENGAGVAVIGFTDIVIPEAMEVAFSLRVAAGANQAYDALDDFLMVEFRLNAGPWQVAISLQNDGTEFNGSLSQDTDFNGVGDGPSLGLAFTDVFSLPITLAAGRLDVRIDAFFNADMESVAFDDFRIVAIPEPLTAPLVAGLFFLLWQAMRLRPRDRPPAPS